MDNFDSNNNTNNFQKAGKALLYVIVITLIFIGGGAFYKYIFSGIESQYNNGFTFNENAPVTAEVTPDVVNMNTNPEQTPTQVPTQVPAGRFVSPTPQTGLTASPSLNGTPAPVKSPAAGTPSIGKTPAPTAAVKSKMTQRERILDEMHKMANTKVVADMVWGEIPMTEENIQSLIDEVSQTNFADRDKLLTILENWKRNDFSNAVNDHNYVWEQLGGTIGKATALR